MKKISCFLLVFFGSFISSLAQQIISLPEVDAIVYSNHGGVFELYKKISDNEYVRVSLDFDTDEIETDQYSDMDLITSTIETEKEIKTRKDLLSDNRKMLNIDDLRTVSIEDYTGKAFDIESSESWPRNVKNSSLVLKFLSSSIVSIQELFYGSKDESSGFGSYLISSKDSVKMWRVGDAEYFLPFVLSFRNGARMFLFTSTGRSWEYILLPEKHRGDQLVALTSPYGGAVLKAAKDKYQITKEDDFYRFRIQEFYAIRPTVQNQYELINAFGENVLKAAYDTIIYQDHFIIAKNTRTADIYNLYKTKLALGNVINAYPFKRGLIEVLNEFGPGYYDKYGHKALGNVRFSYGLCGTVVHWWYSITKKGKRYAMIKKVGGPGSSHDTIEEFMLTDRQIGDAVTFINGDRMFHWDENRGFVGDCYLHPEYLKVRKGNRFGIVEYKYAQDNKNVKPKVKNVSHAFWEEKILTYPTKCITGKVVLAIDNDSVNFGKDGLIYFYKAGKVGIFPRHASVQYDEIRRQTDSFYHIVREGKRGWLDIKTNEEYFDVPYKEG